MSSHNFSSGNKTVRGKQNSRYNLRVATWRIVGRHPKAALLSTNLYLFFSFECRQVSKASGRNCSVSNRPADCDGGYLSNDAPKHRIAIARKNYFPRSTPLFEAFTFRLRVLYCTRDESEIVLSCWQAFRSRFNFDSKAKVSICKNVVVRTLI